MVLAYAVFLVYELPLLRYLFDDKKHKKTSSFGLATSTIFVRMYDFVGRCCCCCKTTMSLVTPPEYSLVARFMKDAPNRAAVSMNGMAVRDRARFERREYLC